MAKAAPVLGLARKGFVFLKSTKAKGSVSTLHRLQTLGHVFKRPLVQHEAHYTVVVRTLLLRRSTIFGKDLYEKTS